MPITIPAAKPLIGQEERDAVDRVLRSGMIAQGGEVAAFETEFADQLVNGRPCVAVSSGTAGLHAGLLACGVGPGDEVIVPSFTFAASANAVALTGATPVFADIDPASYCLAASDVAARITERTCGIMPVHLYGQAADMTALGELADRHGIALFEDAAQAHGASWRNQPVGSFGLFAMFSLYPTKNMTSGEGGMIACANPDIVRLAHLYRNQGMERRYENEVVGLNYRMTDVHAAIGREQLKKLPAWTRQRQENAAFLSANLAGVTVPAIADDATHVFHQYTIRVPEDRDGFAQALAQEYGIGSGVYYPIPIHLLPSFNVTCELPETARACEQVLSLPVHPALSTDDLEAIVTAVNRLAKAGA